MTQAETFASKLNARYDDVMYDPVFIDYFEQTDFANHGYWDAQTTRARQACENLMDQLLALIPKKQGQILDVACGKGETSRYLLKHYRPENVTGINISEKQLATARENVPAATFRLMDATQLDFADASFDAVICVEAAFHFNTRRRFLDEAFRVLKPGGWLSLSDILVTLEAERSRPHRHEVNFLPDLPTYRAQLEAVGFVDISVADVTEECWNNYFRYLIRMYHDRFLSGEITFERMQQILSVTYSRVGEIKTYLLAGARKP